MNCDIYQVGGSLKSDAPSYVERQADRQIYQALKQGDFCYVLNSRQMGKSSLLVRTKHRLEREGFKCTTVDMTNIGSENITPSQWYKGVIADLCLGFKLLGKFNLKTWWQEQEGTPLPQRLSRFISEVLLVQFPQDKIYIFVDEIDSILSLDFPVDDFFALIRFCYNQRAIDPEYNRITFAIFGVATPADLIQDKNRTPFNIGKAIELDGFCLEQIQPLAQGLEVENVNSEAIIKEILSWTEGQPFLTQKICQLVLDYSKDTVSGMLRVPPGTESFWVESIVRERLIDKWESQDEPQHLRTIRDRVLANELIAGRLLGIYQQVLAREEVGVNDSREHIELLLSGLVTNDRGKLKPKTRIYQAVFHAEWVAKQLENLRPYAPNFQFWIGSGQQDESQLLRGMALQSALNWAENKKLSDLDYRFLAASQSVANREIESYLAAEKQARKIDREKAQFALQSAQQAHQILAKARKNAKQNSQNIRLAKGWIASIAGIVASLLIVLRLTGLLQGMEWNALDRFFQARPPERIDSRIAIVTIDDSDISRIGQYPLSDRVLATAIETLKTYQPRAIGLDLYRDLPVQPGDRQLAEVFRNTRNLIGTQKVVGSKIPPPPVLAQLERVGFADQVLDGDGKVRRALLSVQQLGGKLQLNLGLRLALSYLKTEGITPEDVPNHPYQMMLGKALVIPFGSNDGGYVRADSGGYQVLLNFHGTREQFETFSMSDLLANRIPPEKIRDRIVLIGSIADSVNDLFQTPYSSRIFGPAKQMAGVTIHANIASQILSAALDGRPMLQVWSEASEWLWILLWCTTGAALAWLVKNSKLLVFVVLVAEGGLIGIAYLVFLRGWWIPVIPPLMGLVIGAITLPILSTKQLERIQLCLTLKYLITISKQQPAAGQIAIEYLKLSETTENQALIDRMWQELYLENGPG